MMARWKALIIDDNAEIRMIFSRVLTMHDVETVEAQDGKEGIERLNSENFDVVVTDVSMPRADGFAALRHARKVAPCVPVVMVSGSWLSGQKELAQNLGVTRTLDKPIDIVSFWQTIEELLTSEGATGN